MSRSRAVRPRLLSHLYMKGAESKINEELTQAANSAKVTLTGASGLFFANTSNVARADGPAIIGIAIGTIKGSP